MSYASDALINAQKREIEQLKIENVKLKAVIRVEPEITASDKASFPEPISESEFAILPIFLTYNPQTI